LFVANTTTYSVLVLNLFPRPLPCFQILNLLIKQQKLFHKSAMCSLRLLTRSLYSSSSLFSDSESPYKTAKTISQKSDVLSPTTYPSSYSSSSLFSDSESPYKTEKNISQKRDVLSPTTYSVLVLVLFLVFRL
jgi:hypothetical protein